MQPTGVVINRESWLLLREEPVYSVRFIDREGTQELAVVSRVEDLDWFIEAPLPLTLRLSTWQSPEQIWVVAIGYQLHPTFGGSKGGVFYLNRSCASGVSGAVWSGRCTRRKLVFPVAGALLGLKVGGNVVCARRPERAEKSQKVCLLFVVKRLDKRIACLLCLSTVERNRLGEGQRSPIVEVGGGIGHAPQPGGGELRGQLFSE